MKRADANFPSSKRQSVSGRRKFVSTIRRRHICIKRAFLSVIITSILALYAYDNRTGPKEHRLLLSGSSSSEIFAAIGFIALLAIVGYWIKNFRNRQKLQGNNVEEVGSEKIKLIFTTEEDRPRFRGNVS